MLGSAAIAGLCSIYAPGYQLAKAAGGMLLDLAGMGPSSGPSTSRCWA